MQPKPTTSVRNIRTSRLSARRELRAGVIQWSEQAKEQRQRTLPLPPRTAPPAAVQAPPPAAPGEDGTETLLPAWLENFVLGLAAGATMVLAIASGAGAL